MSDDTILTTTVLSVRNTLLVGIVLQFIAIVYIHILFTVFIVLGSHDNIIRCIGPLTIPIYCSGFI